MAAVGAFAAALVPAGAAQAASYSVYSSDLHARTTFSVTWYGQKHAAVAWTNSDLKADGRGAIMRIQGHSGWGDNEPGYDHVLSGAGHHHSGTTQVTMDDPLELTAVVVTECNGGSHDYPQRCDSVSVDNPYN